MVDPKMRIIIGIKEQRENKKKKRTNKAMQQTSTNPLLTRGTNGAHSAYTLTASKTAKAQFSDAFCISGDVLLLLLLLLLLLFVLKCFSQASRIAPVTSPIVCVIPPSKSLTLSANTSSECKATSSATYFAIIAPNSHSYASTRSQHPRDGFAKRDPRHRAFSFDKLRRNLRDFRLQRVRFSRSVSCG